ncbi:hypothetical protein NP554_18780 [Pseudomonas asiatica]|uniref:Uncharacterized protein n=1 Tax=Pseudomonas asiatica TaxID=2219225 RepID=A0A9X4DHF2_9PSED|nr:hypothetical protein [Pseudomonas asiatica]MDD2113824.1 hypothetical protein [Pseudomonas asiatica]
MKSNVQLILDQNEAPIFAVLPYAEYTRLIANQSNPKEALTAPSLLSEDRRYIRLPHGGPGAKLDVVELLDWLNARAITDLAINQRAQTLDKFPQDQSMTLDPIIRRVFLPESSPYKNTMQAVAEVVDALVETGCFKRIKKSYPSFYRAVNALEIDWTEASQFLKGRAN